MISDEEVCVYRSGPQKRMLVKASRLLFVVWASSNRVNTLD